MPHFHLSDLVTLPTAWLRRKPRSNPTHADTPEVEQGPSDSPDTSSGSRIKSNDDQWRFKVLAEGDSPNVDIVAIHGMDGSREESWTARNGKCWLRDFLPNQVPRGRILVYGYDAYTRSRENLSVLFLSDVANNFISDLARFREDSPERPIIFIAHSLGGIVLKSALISAKLRSRDNMYTHKQIFLSTYGILFLGTPHQGSRLVEIAVKILTVASLAKIKKSNTNLMQHLKPHSEKLQSLQSEFDRIASSIVIKSAYERHKTPLKFGLSSLIVPRDSAVTGCADKAEVIEISANHETIAKFPSEDDDGFQKVCKCLQDMATAAPTVIQARFQRQVDNG